MKRGSSGFTVVEVIIFLGVTGFILAISFSYLSGNIGRNRFSQSMRDTQSKVQDWLNDIPTGYTGSTGGTTGQAHCFSTPGKIQIQSGPANPANPNENNGDCIYLGKAIQFTDSYTTNTDQDSKIFAYSIFGNRTITPPTESERPVATLAEAKPFAAVGNGNCANCSGTADLTEQFTLSGGTRVKSIVKSSGVPASDNSHLAGFFLSFNQLQTTGNGSSSVVTYQYPLDGNQDPANDGNGNNPVYKCLNLDSNVSGTNCSVLSPMTDWEICFYNGNNGQMALLTLSSVGGLGVSTKLEFKTC